MLVQLGNQGHVRCASLVKHEGRWHCHMTPWHGHLVYAIIGYNINLSFSWRHPSCWLSPQTLRYDQRLETCHWGNVSCRHRRSATTRFAQRIDMVVSWPGWRNEFCDTRFALPGLWRDEASGRR